MILYNITLNIDNDITDDCLDYLKGTFIRQATASRVMQSPKIHRVLPNETSDSQSGSYAIQFNVKNIDTLNYWIEHEGQHISKQLISRFGNKIAGFTTVLEEIELSK